MVDNLLSEVQEHFSNQAYEYIKDETPTKLNFAYPETEGYALEIGCGAKFSLETPLEKVGVDITHSLLVALKNRFPEVNVVLADSRHLPFRSQVFCVTGSMNVLHHLVGDTAYICKANICNSVSELSRVSTQTGRILILEHLASNRFYSRLMFYSTWLFAKLDLNIGFLDIHGRVITFFLDEVLLDCFVERLHLRKEVVSAIPWRLQKLKLGYDKQLCLYKN